jgi:hypothetical protein
MAESQNGMEAQLPVAGGGAGEEQPVPCHHLILHRILIVGQPHYQCGACDVIFDVPQAYTIVVREG